MPSVPKPDRLFRIVMGHKQSGFRQHQSVLICFRHGRTRFHAVPVSVEGMPYPHLFHAELFLAPPDTARQPLRKLHGISRKIHQQSVMECGPAGVYDDPVHRHLLFPELPQFFVNLICRYLFIECVPGTPAERFQNGRICPFLTERYPDAAVFSGKAIVFRHRSKGIAVFRHRQKSPVESCKSTASAVQMESFPIGFTAEHIPRQRHDTDMPSAFLQKEVLGLGQQCLCLFRPAAHHPPGAVMVTVQYRLCL